MKREKVEARRVRDGKPVDFYELVPESDEDRKEIERLDREGLIARGDTFQEQREHDRLVKHRRYEGSGE